MIKDSGERTVYENGFQRDMHDGKGRMDLLPWNAIMELSKHCEEGAKKYGEHNIDLGCAWHSLADSGSRHLAKWIAGIQDEPHLLAACWNLMWLLEETITHPELNDMFWNKPTEDQVEDACPIDKPCKQEKSSMDYVYSVLLDCGITNKDRPDIGSLNDLAKQQYAEFQKNQRKAASDMWTCPKCGRQYQWHNSGIGRYSFCPKCQLASKEDITNG